jgi:hypothetical protein
MTMVNQTAQNSGDMHKSFSEVLVKGRIGEVSSVHLRHGVCPSELYFRCRGVGTTPPLRIGCNLSPVIGYQPG